MVVDTLSGRYTLLSVLEAKMLGFQTVQVLYKDDLDFKEVLQGEPREVLTPSILALARSLTY